MTKRLFALFLTLVMVLQPVLPAAAEAAGEDTAVLAAEETVETTEAVEESEEITEESTEATEEAEEPTEEATEEATEETEETTEETETTGEPTVETEGPTETTEPDGVDYAVVHLICDVDGVTFHVYPAATEEDPEPEEILAQEDGSYWLVPGEYWYSAAGENVAPIERDPLLVTKEDVGRDLEIQIVMEYADFGYGPLGPSENGTTGNARWRQNAHSMEIYGGTYMADYEENEYKWATGCNYYVYIKDVYNVGANAFRNDAVQTLKLADTVTTIGTQAFQDCKNLRGVHFPDSIRTIKSRAFSGTGLVAVRFPAGVQTIEYNAFSNCPYLDRVFFSGTEEQWQQVSIASGNDVLKNAEIIYNFTGDGVISVDSGNGSSSCDWILDGGYQLTIIGKGEIPSPNSQSRWGLTEKLVLKGNMYAGSISKRFSSCTNLQEVVIYDHPTLGNSPFAGCTNLVKVTFPSSWTEIPENFFKGSCIRSYQIPEQITKIGKDAFRDCTWLMSFSFATNTPEYQESGLFSGCSSLRKLVFPKNLETIPANIAKGCSSLREVVFPGNVKTLEPYAFSSTGILSIAIPDTVTTVGKYAFYNCQYLASAKLPKGLTELSEDVFRACSNLSSVTWPEHIKTIGPDAFYGCKALTALTIPEGVTQIGSCAFSGCVALASLKLPESLTTIGNYAFSGCAFEQIQIPRAITSIEYNAFSSCKALTEITIPSSITAISNSLFSGCTSLKDVHLPSGLQSIGNYAFESCTSLESISLPDNLKTIGQRAFSTCTALKKVVIPAKVTKVESEAFLNCTALTEITFPGSLADTGLKNCLSGCTNLTTVVMKEGIKGFAEGLLSQKPKLKTVTLPSTLEAIPKQAFQGSTGLTAIGLPSNIASIGEQAFSGCSALKKLVLPSMLTSIGSKAFENCAALTEISFPGRMRTLEPNDCLAGCTSLTTVTLADGIEELGSGFFKGRESLKNVTLPKTLKTISANAFRDCTGLESIIVPANVTTIGSSAFQGCTALKDVQLPDKLTTISDSAFRDCTALKEMVLPDSVTTIGSSAFYMDEALESINIPSRLSTINSYTFYGTALKAVTIPTKVTTISTSAFRGAKLRSVTIPQSVTTTGQYAFADNSQLTEVTVMEGMQGFAAGVFSGCKNLSTITVPKSIQIFGEDAFNNCGSLKKVRYLGNWRQWCAVLFYPGNEPVLQADVRYSPSGTCGADVEWALESDGTLVLSGTGAMSSFASAGAPWNPQDIKKVIVESGITKIGASAFAGCSGLEEVSLPNTVTQIDANGFSLCSNLERITLPEGLETVKSRAFSDCTSLVEITIPSTLQTIGVEAFDNCTGLETVNYLGTRAQWDEMAISTGNTALTDAELRIRLASGTTGDLAWVLMEDGTLIFSGAGKMADYSSSQPAPWDKTKVHNVQIGADVTYIGSYAFAGCTKLDLPQFPEGLTGIGTAAFQGCTGLEFIQFPASLKTIQKDAFSGCTALDTVYYSGKLNQWGQITIGAGNQALTNAKLLYEGRYAVSGTYCKNVTWKLDTNGTLTISGTGKMVDYTGDDVIAVWRDADVKKVVIQQGITSIGKGVFYRCAALKEVTISPTVTEIGVVAFSNCTVLTTISLPASLKIVGEEAFLGCPALTTVRYSGKQEQWDAITIASGNEALTNAKLLLSTYMLTYKNVDGATNPNPDTADKDKALTLKDAARTGYLFGGWYKEDSFKTKVTSIPAGNEADVTLYAKWTPISYTVSFDANGGTGSIAKKTVSYGELAELPKTGFSRTGYTFTGWNTKADGKGTAYTLGQTVTNLSSTQGANVTLYAQWKANSYQVIFNLNGGTGKVDSISTVYDTTCTLPKTAPARTGYTLTGWNTKADGTGTAYALGAQVKNLTAASGGKVTLYAVWKANTYSVRFYSNDGTQNSSLQSDLSYGMEYTLNANSFQWKGRVFLGWAETAGGAVKYANSAKVKDLTAENGATVNLYAQWRLVTYQVTYDANGGEGKLENQQVTYGDTFRLPGAEALTRDLYSFSGWTASIGEETKTYQPGQELKDLTETDGAIIVFQAVWSPNFGTIGTLEWALHNDGLLTLSGTGRIPDYSATQAAPWAKAQIRKIQISEGITYIGSQAFGGCENLAEVALPGSLEGIGAGAFQGCGNDLIYRYAGSLAQWGEVSYQTADDPTASGVVLYESTKYMNGTCGNASWKLQTDGTLRFSGTGAAKAPDNEVHWSLEDVHSVTVEDGITELGANLLRDCVAMTTATLPKTLKTVGSNAFSGCSSLATVRYPGKQEQWDAISIGSGNSALTSARLLLSTYMITYVNVDGAKNPNPDVADKETALELKDASRTGYLFDGWYKESSFQTKMTSIPAGNEEDVTLYAKWFRRAYLVYFHSNSGTGKMDSQLLWYDQEEPLSKNKFTRKGYAFAGWSLTAGETEIVFQDEDSVLNLADGEQVISIDLYAQWTPIAYYLTLDANGGTGAPEGKQVLRYGTPYTLPTAQEVLKEGYGLSGWTGKINGSKKTYKPGTQLKDLTTVAGTEYTLTAQWGPLKYTVRFEPGAGTGKAKTQAMTYGKAAALTANSFKRAGYTFEGWLAEDGTVYSNKESVINLTSEPDGVVTLTAQWRPVAYRIVFDVNGGTGEVPGSGGYYTCGVTYTIPQSDLIRQGYRFMGWSTKKGGKVAYQEGSSVKDLATTEGKAVTLYAVWQPEGYAIRFEANNGTGSSATVSGLTSGKAATLRANSFQKPGYKFTGWNTEPDGSGTAYKNKAKATFYVDDGTVELYAQWEQIQYTVTYKNVPIGSEGDNPSTYTIEEGLQLEDGFVRGMTFEGWYLDAKFKTPFTGIAPGGNARNVTVYAKLSGNAEQYNIYFHGNSSIATGETKNMYDLCCDKTYALSANAYKCKGYKFIGWSSDPDATIPEFTNKQKIANLQYTRIHKPFGETSSATIYIVDLYAIWEPIQYTITYKGVTADELRETGNVTTYVYLEGFFPNNPVRPGCEFGDWYMDAGFKKYFSNLDVSLNPRNITIYAKWYGTPVKYTIAYNGNGAASGSMKAQNTSCGKELTLTKNAFKRPGYTFLGWSTDPKATEPEFTNKQKVSNLRSTGGTVTLYAVWEAIPYTVTLKNIGGATVAGAQNGVLEYTVTGRNLPVPVLPGAKFAGWYTTANFKDGTEVKELRAGTTGNKVLYAKWQIQ